MSATPRARRLLGDVVSFGLGNLSAQLVTIVMIPYYTRHLSTSEYGTVDLILATAALALPVATLSVSDSVLRFVVNDPERRGPILAGGLVVTALGAVVCLAASLLVDAVTDSRLLLWSLPALVTAQAFQNLIAQYTRAMGGSRLFAVSGLIQALSLAAANVAFIGAMNMGVVGYVLSVLVASGIATVFLAAGAYRNFGRTAFKVEWALVRTMLSYSAPLVPNATIWWVVNLSSRFFLLAIVGVGAVGVYAIAVRIPTLLAVLSLVFTQAWQLSAFREYSAHDRDRFYSKVFELYSSYLCIGVAVMLVALKPALSEFVAPEYYTAWKFAPFLLLASLFMAFSSFVGTHYLATMGTRLALSTSIVGGLSCVLLSVLLIPHWAGVGAAVATMGGYLVMWLTRAWNTRHMVRMRPRYRTLVVNLSLIATQVVVLHAQLRSETEFTVLVLLIGSIMVANRRELSDGWRQATTAVRQVRS